MGSKKYKKKMIVFTAPSGAGKTTIVKHLLKKYKQLSFSVSATTRPKRANETDGQEYYFMDKKTFQKNIKAGAFIEWEEVYQGRYYGTLKSEIKRLLNAGKVIIFDIEVIGATDIKNQFRDDCFVVFVKPPSLQKLIRRLTDRKTETPEDLKKRIQRIKKELSYENAFDYVLMNDDLDKALEEAEGLIENNILN